MVFANHSTFTPAHGDQADPILLRSKIVVPALTSEHLARPRLLAALDAGAAHRLTLVVAPAGYGKSRLLVEWCRRTAASHPTAWLSLDVHDNDPVTFWSYLVSALCEAFPDRFSHSLAVLRRGGDGLARAVVLSLLNELWHDVQETRLVLDDVQLLTNPACLESLRIFLEQVPPRCQLVLASRTDPSLGLARLRVRGQLRELGATELAFTPAEALAFLNDTLQLRLGTDSVARLEGRTEGWAAGLYLAALSLRDHPDPQGFVAAFVGQHRHIVDYFGSEVLEQLPEPDHTFLVQTAILEQLSAPLCDAVLGTADAAQRLRRLAQQNLFVFPLDEAWQWFRYHPLFRDLLLADLGRCFPDRLSELHRRAAAWHAAAEDAPTAMQHALATGDEGLVGDLFVAFALPLLRAGRLATLTAWLATVTEAALAARPALALASAWVAAHVAQPPAEVHRRIAVAASGPDEGPFMAGEPSLAAAVALARAAWLVDDVGAALADAQAAVAAVPDPGMPAYLPVRQVLGQALYLAGRPAEAHVQMEAALRARLAPDQTAGFSRALATQALVCLALGEEARAGEFARRAQQLAEQSGPVAERGQADGRFLWLSYAALGQVLVRERRLTEAATVLAQGVEPRLDWLRAWPLMNVLALVPLVLLHHAQGRPLEARARLAEARAALLGCRDAGMLPRLVTELERGLRRQVVRPAELHEALTESELRILRLLATDLSQREIGRELYLSVNTVKSHTRTIYGKLAVAARAEAVARARALHLLA